MRYLVRKIIIIMVAALAFNPQSLAQMNIALETTEYTVNLYDTTRSRLIPIAIYYPKIKSESTKVIIFNHGYDKNIGGSYKVYSYLTRSLAANGYFVISIQHELPHDNLLSMEGDLYTSRMPNWERGVENILFTMNEFKKLRTDLNWLDVTLIGHSNGGDMTMLFATRYPKLITKAISLDNRRMPLPRTDNPQISSIRGCDYEADASVLPTPEEQKKYSIEIIQFDDIRHTDMDNKGNETQHSKICQSVLSFLNK